MTKSKNKRLTARSADKFALYEQSVQAPDVDVYFIRRVFRKVRGREPLSLREDFCGTAKLCAEWVQSSKQRHAVGLDLDQPTLDYGLRKHIEPLGDAARRVQLLNRDVCQGADEPVDVGVAFNFSYCIFKTRREMVDYFRAAFRGTKEDGAFVFDMHGGPDAQIEVEEKTRHGNFTYVWEQAPMDAVSNHAMRYIHFHFPDRTKLRRAFTYDWRVWSLPELREMLAEAGFFHVDVYWEGTNKDGEGNGVFRRVQRATNEDSWIAYLVAWR